jgi:hypothetical protein
VRTADEFKQAIGFGVASNATDEQIESQIDAEIDEAIRVGRRDPGKRFYVLFPVQPSWPRAGFDRVLAKYSEFGWRVTPLYGFASKLESISLEPEEW